MARENLQTCEWLEILPVQGGMEGELRNDKNSNRPDMPRENLQTCEWLEFSQFRGAWEGSCGTMIRR